MDESMSEPGEGSNYERCYRKINPRIKCRMVVSKGELRLRINPKSRFSH